MGKPTWPGEAIFPPRGLSEAERKIEPKALQMEMDDGYLLAVQHWRNEGTKSRGRVVVLHGVQSHAGWYHGLGRRLAAAGFEAWFPDRRGSGANQAERGHASSARRLVSDVAEVCQQAGRSSIGSGSSSAGPLVLAGISWGGKLAIAGAAQNEGLVAGVALLCPGLTPRVDVSLIERLRVASAVLTGRSARARFPIPLADPALFTAQSDAREFIAHDPLSLREGTAGLLASSFVLDRQVRAATRQVKQPTLLILAGQDRIVDNDRTLDYFQRLASTRKEVAMFPDGHHTLEFELDPAPYARKLVEWLGSVAFSGSH